MPMLEKKHLRASHDSRQHIDAIFIDLRIENIFLKYTGDPKIFDLFGKEFNKSTVCAFFILITRSSVGFAVSEDPMVIQHTFGSQDIESSCLSKRRWIHLLARV